MTTVDTKDTTVTTTPATTDPKLDQIVSTLIDGVTAAEAKVLQGKFDPTTIGTVLIIVMKFVGNDYPTLTGVQKKQLVISILQKLCPSELIDQLIPPLIDNLISVDNGSLKINPTLVDKLCCCRKKKPVVPPAAVTK